LYLAYYKSSKGKKSRQDVIDFSKDLDNNLKHIQNQLMNKAVIIGDYHYFKIKDPKERIICAASFPERVIHHAIMNITEKYFEDFQIYNSYACRKYKGMHRAVKKAFNVCKKYDYYIKFDIRKFFDNVDHKILFNLLERRFKDKDLLDLFKQIIDSYETLSGKGIPIGNLTSQHFANYYLAYLDRFIKQELQIKDYIRYMDDFVLFCDKINIRNMIYNIKVFLTDKLKLNLKPPLINKVSNGFPFLGCHIYKNKILLSKRSRIRFKKKFIKYESYFRDDIWDMNELISHINPLIAFTEIANSRNLRNYLIKKYGIISE